MSRETEDQIMGWYIIMMISLFVAGTLIAEPAPAKAKCACTEVAQ